MPPDHRVGQADPSGPTRPRTPRRDRLPDNGPIAQPLEHFESRCLQSHTQRLHRHSECVSSGTTAAVKGDGGTHGNGEIMNEDSFLDADETHTALISGETFSAKPVTYSVVTEPDPDTGEDVRLAVFEGCIVLGTVDEIEHESTNLRTDEPEGVQHGVGLTGRRFRWVGGVVPYEIHADLPNQSRVTDAISHWQQRTRIRFVRRTSANASRYPNWVRFRAATGCWSQVGMRGERQDIGLAAGCGLGATIHEVGHAVGLWHEQSREDRNQFVRINYQNITPGREHNFNQQITDGDDYGGYDYGSIMHYGSTAFSRNGQPTVVPLRSGVTIGQRNGLSSGDISAIRSMYPNLEPSRSWVGTQFRGTVPATTTTCWFTHSWPAHWHVHWTVVPTGPARDAGAQVEWTVRATLQSENVGGYGSLIKYFICIKNLTNESVGVEARYNVAGWTR